MVVGALGGSREVTIKVVLGRGFLAWEGGLLEAYRNFSSLKEYFVENTVSEIKVRSWDQ